MIELFDGWKIGADDLCYTLYQDIPFTKRNGEPDIRKDIVGFYPSVEAALKALANTLIARDLNDGVYTLREAIDVIQREHKRMEEYIAKEVSGE